MSMLFYLESTVILSLPYPLCENACNLLKQLCGRKEDCNLIRDFTMELKKNKWGKDVLEKDKADCHSLQYLTVRLSYEVPALIPYSVVFTLFGGCARIPKRFIMNSCISYAMVFFKELEGKAIQPPLWNLCENDSFLYGQMCASFFYQLLCQVILSI
jgi:hypothetical protein